MKKTKKNISILFISLILIAVVTSLAQLLKYINLTWLKIIAKVGINLLNGLVSFVAMKITGMNLKIDFKNKRQYLIGVIMALLLNIAIVIIPIFCGYSLVGNHMDFSWAVIIYDLLFCLLIIGPIEELIFRVYLQDTFVSFFEKNKWLGVVIASFLFGLWHIINGNFVQVILTFGIGLVLGFSKHKIKNCGYIALSLGHGLYDFLITIVKMFII